MDDEKWKMKKRQIKSFDGFFSLWKVSLIPHTRTRLKTQQQNTYLQTMFAATQQIASIAGLKATKVQVRFTSSSLLFDLYYPSSSSSSSSRWEEDGDGRWWTSSSKMCNISFDARALVRCTKCSRNAPNMNERAHVHPFLLYVRVLSRIVRIVHPFSPRLYFQTKIARIPFEILVLRYAPLSSKRDEKKQKMERDFWLTGSFPSFS